MKNLTERQKQILDFIRHRQTFGKLTPTLREIASHFGFSSPNAALAHVQALRAKGVLKNLPGCARSLQVVVPGTDGVSPALDPEAPASHRRSLISQRTGLAGGTPALPEAQIVSVPIYGAIPAGKPIDTVQEQEGCVLIDVDTLGIKPTTRTFGLKVQGDSMIGKNIIDGDTVIIEHGVQPRSGDVVAALIDGQVTLKTFILQQGKPYLRAENARYPNLIPQEELQIQGVMVALVRRRK
jgi:repressor LexA